MKVAENLKILIVDDRPENLVSMKQLLQRPDLMILTAGSGDEALSLMLDHDLALVLLDVQMPGMDGFEVASLMRSNERTRNLPVIFVTAINKEKRHIFSGYQVGAVDYLFKPIDPFIIRSKVGVFLELKKMEMIREKLNAELCQANNRLKELSDNKSNFLAAASHELRTPLTVIKENCSLVKDEIVGPLTDDQLKCMDAALRNCNRLANLVDDLLDLDSVESGAQKMRREAVDVGEILATCETDFLPKAKVLGLDLQVDVATDLPRVLGDEGMITQVVVNLLGNAVKFTPKGGRIVLGGQVSDGKVMIRVQDDGPGIAPEDRGRVFDKFTQVNRTHGPGPKGTGLGLAISRKISQLLEGRLDLESQVGVGSTFTFAIQIYDEIKQLSAFVRDGTRNILGVSQDWTLLLFKDKKEPTVLPSWLDEVVERAIRFGDDRVMPVKRGGSEMLAVLLKTNQTGAASFLSRLEEMVSRKIQGDNDLCYALLDLPQELQADLIIAEEDIEFLNLSLNIEPMGENSEQGKNPGS
ncbi:MAG: hybrid sensor histidine kinase/response regulator [Gemmatimonadales bacterium]|nr:hybrid sensor histidine kinase/response regulator [Gemmatimonadales bacterium]